MTDRVEKWVKKCLDCRAERQKSLESKTRESSSQQKVCERNLTSPTTTIPARKESGHYFKRLLEYIKRIEVGSAYKQTEENAHKALIINHTIYKKPSQKITYQI